MELKDYPLKINDTILPFTKTFQISPKTIENENQGETGKDIIQIARLDKKEVSISTTLTGEWIPILRGFYLETEPLEVFMYDIETGAYKTYDMRLRDLSYRLSQHSEDLEGIEGVWDISFKLKEF